MTDPTKALVASWSDNATLWTRAVRDRLIASRATTDAAVLAAACRSMPRQLLDVGCGEGWLCRAMANLGARCVGIDGSPDLVAAARAGGAGSFHHLGYAELAARPESIGSGFETIICNFSLLDDDAAGLLDALAAVAAPGATLLIQTVHPLGIDPPYADGWRRERFEAFGAGAWTEMPWYFRTLSSWVAAISGSWDLRGVEEPMPPATSVPVSLLMRATLRHRCRT